MKAKRFIKGTTLGAIGFLLSPLSWWNDLFVNIPLALLFAWFVSIFLPKGFMICFVVGYWLTNVLGFVLLHKGAQLVVSDKQLSYNRKSLFNDLVISFLYTVVIVLLLKFKLVKPLPNYFAGP